LLDFSVELFIYMKSHFTPNGVHFLIWTSAQTSLTSHNKLSVMMLNLQS